MRQAVDAEQREQRHPCDSADAATSEAPGAHRRKLVATAFGPAPVEPEDEPASHDSRRPRLRPGATAPRGARFTFTPGRGHGLELDQRLGLKLRPVGQRLALKLNFSEVLTGLQALPLAVLAIVRARGAWR